MTAIRLEHPVRTLDHRLVLDAGTVLTSEILDELTSSHQDGSCVVLPMLSHGTIYQDLVRFMRQGPYRIIFGDPERTTALLGLTEKIRLPSPIFESLDLFKKHDPYTYRHILMVFIFSTLLAQDLVSDYQDLLHEAEAAPMHDFGKICVPFPILKKAAPLTRAEKTLLEHHASAGFVLLSYYLQDCRGLAATVARDHHERRDGSGYPLGISLADALVEIVAACDVYDALISTRPYRPISFDNRSALEEIVGMSLQGKLGWEVVQILVAYNRRDKPHFKECRVSTEKRGKPPEGNLYGVIVDDETFPSNRGPR